MGRVVGGTLRVVALALGCIIAPAQAGQVDAGEAVVDASFKRFTQELKNKRDRLVLWLRAEPQDGRLKVCGAYLAMMPEDRYSQLAGWLGDLNSHLLFGSKTGRGQRVAPSFLAGRRLEGGGGPIQRTDERTAKCVLTDAAWDDRFANDPFDFLLRETTYVR